MVYESLEPFDGQRIELYLAQIAHILANAHRGPKSPPIPFDQCLFKFGEQRRELTTEEKRQRFMSALSKEGGGKRGAKDRNRKPAGSLNRDH